MLFNDKSSRTESERVAEWARVRAAIVSLGAALCDVIYVAAELCSESTDTAIQAQYGALEECAEQLDDFDYVS